MFPVVILVHMDVSLKDSGEQSSLKLCTCKTSGSLMKYLLKEKNNTNKKERNWLVHQAYVCKTSAVFGMIGLE